jgi:class 3 adenylate cyclase/CHASE2 domain-containing sensor protein
VEFKPVKLAPVLIATSVIVVVCLARVLHFDLFDRLERITYDWRVRTALRFPQPVATNLGAIFISDDSIKALNDGSLGYRYGFYWPRHIYGRLIRESSAQGARAVALDILFGELHPKDDPVPEQGTRRREAMDILTIVRPGQEQTTFTNDQGETVTLIDSDDYFACQLKRSGRAILAAEQGVPPHALFATNALAVGDISADADGDGVLRRVKAFRDYYDWDPVIVAATAGTDVDLAKSRVAADRIELFTGSDRPLLDESGKLLSIKLNSAGEFDVREFIMGELPPGEVAWRRPFIVQRVWHMGIVLAAQELKLDLANARVDLEHGRIALRGDNGLQRLLPVDDKGYFDINWELTVADGRLTKAPIEDLIKQDIRRSEGRTNDWVNTLKDKLIVVGSTATGNNITDRGATPLEKNTFLVSKHWNVANSIITGRFVRRASLPTELALIALLGIVTAILTWQLRVFSAAGGVILLALVYCAAGLFLYVQYRYWAPLVLPIIGAMVVEHVSLVTYRVVFEQSERRRVRSVFSKIVSPNVVNELLEAETLSLGGARREVTVLFADVRGFTELTDTSHERVAAYVRERQLTGEAAEACFDESARETLNTVNLYLACVADYVKQHAGTLDKYIGDCVMAFWGAPTPNSKHALASVQAAIDAQRAIHRLNQQRLEESRQLEVENQARASAGLPPKPLHATLKLGTGINSGLVTVGLMGSDAHILNYTVFGREVNLASRLEGVSGHGRIVISEATYKHLQRDDPALAATCIELEPVKPKGFKEAVKIYAVPWLPPAPVPAATTVNAAAPSEPQ